MVIKHKNATREASKQASEMVNSHTRDELPFTEQLIGLEYLKWI